MIKTDRQDIKFQESQRSFSTNFFSFL